MYSTHNEGKSVVAERLIRTLKNWIFKHMNSMSKNVYVDKLDYIVNEYINTYHRTTKIKPIDVKDNTYIDFGKEKNDKDPKFQVGGHVRICKTFFQLKKWKIEYHGHMLFMILIMKKLFKLFMKNKCKKQTKKNLG